MTKNKTQPYYWENIIAIAVVGIFCIFGLISWIVASNYSLDLKFSEALDNGMKYKFIRFWTMFRVLDGYEGVVTFILPMVFVIAESFLLAMKKARPHGWFAHHHASFTWVYLLMAALWSAGITLESVYFFFSNQGFGRGYWYWFQTGWSYLIPGFVVSLTIQLVYLWTATWYVHWKLARRHDFLTNQYWKRACVALLTIGFIYIPIAVFKSGLRREYLYNIKFADLLTRMETDFPQRFAFYLNQGGIGGWDYGFNPDAYSDSDLKNLFGERYFEYVQNRKAYIQEWIQNWNTENPENPITLVNKYYFNFPGNSSRDLFNNPRPSTDWNYFDSNQTYPWYKPTGWGKWGGDNNLLKEAIPHQSAFPSGHMAAAFGICMTVYIFKGDRQKSVVIGRRIGFVAGLIFCLDMFFSLAISLSHWWSDLGFTMFWLGPALITAYGVTMLGTKVLVNPFFKWVKNWNQPHQK
ncbi:phosphatase PAP2 family protein [Mesoplasma whartonense]|uniref:phosphatase PAP2 family protein n=1 Tax=Mesoplasma whartonense TaxID=2878854 RepID=UPI0020229C52|nr:MULTISPECIES: phosphatase PAP2 family protein [unclassified Mesoplasma]MCL8212906.1 hypothetical protein [Mesoplasma sp. JKS002661]MCL8216105.1 hypothetical protein [Mesoplasma sp. JKS002657]